MVLTPTHVVFALQAAARLGAAAREAYRTGILDTSLPMPLPEGGVQSLQEQAEEALLDEARAIAERDGLPFVNGLVPVAAAIPELAECYIDTGQRALFAPDSALGRQFHARALQALQNRLTASVSSDARERESLAEASVGYVMLQQWRSDARPAGPVGRVALAVVETVLDATATYPALFGLGSRGETLVGAFATHVKSWLPDPDTQGDWSPWRIRAAETGAVVLLRAGLQTLHDHTDALIDDDRMERMIGAVLTPYRELVETRDASDRLRLTDIRESLLAPMAQAAARTLADAPSLFLGEGFDPESGAAGAVARAILEAFADADDVSDAFGKEGLITAYKTLLGVAAERPELFTDSDAAQAYLRSVASILSSTDRPPPFSPQLAAELAASALKVVAQRAPGRVDGTGTWSEFARDALRAVFEGFSEGFGTGAGGGGRGPLERLLGADTARELVEILFAHAAETPGMLTGDGASAEVKAIAASIAAILAKDATHLISVQGWRDILGAALAAAAKNPGTLFRLDVTDPKEQLAAVLFGKVFETAGALFADAERKAGRLAFGATLVEASKAVIDAAARNLGNAIPASQRAEALATLITQLDGFARDEALSMSADDWLFVFRFYVAEAVSSGTLPRLTAQGLTTLLATDAAGRRQLLLGNV